MMPANRVDRCVCHFVMFKDMLPLIDRLRQSGVDDEHTILDHLRTKTKCTTGCALCEPYIRQMIRTGQTQFVPLSFGHE
ncbi:hypothetical protein COB72_08425 [bacterium]|nr:MAG: hypothetical protein COB72_08425 [bacterium]